MRRTSLTRLQLQVDVFNGTILPGATVVYRTALGGQVETVTASRATLCNRTPMVDLMGFDRVPLSQVLPARSAA